MTRLALAVKLTALTAAVPHRVVADRGGVVGEVSAVVKVACGSCGRLFSKDEHAWAADWKVCDAPDWVWRMETRYTCDSCHGGAA